MAAEAIPLLSQPVIDGVRFLSQRIVGGGVENIATRAICRFAYEIGKRERILNLLTRWRRLASSVGKAVRMWKALFIEVHFRPDNEGAAQCADHFRDTLASIAATDSLKRKAEAPADARVE